MTNKKALIVFVKAPIYGEVKTRIAQTAGDEIAAKIYRELLSYTLQLTSELNDISVFVYSNKVFQHSSFSKVFVQQGASLGDKMVNAFQEVFSLGFDKAVLIGSDCLEIDRDTILESFNVLENFDVVINPVTDGGYCLIGMKEGLKPIFNGIEWSTEKVFGQTILLIKKVGLNFESLPMKSDIDYWEDLPIEWRRRFKKG
jgi:hypothetical protein